ncbi:MAG: 30S ribosomal protein S4e [Candidatus Aenigmarchaeota archaeon]|nr:30S ribosomal protein S4e [Candidatus Aenigmarchaeota archaeon]
MKRNVMPGFWKMQRKTNKFAVEPLPGPHKKAVSIPLTVLLRDILKYSATAREAKNVLGQGLVKVDGIVRKERRFAVGVMDIVSIGSENYIIMPGKKGIEPKKIKDAAKRLCKIKGKSITKRGKVQLHLYNGHNMLTEGDYSPGDTLVMETGTSNIKGVLRMKEGSRVVITNGKNSGIQGKIKKIITTKSSQPNIMVIESDSGDIALPKDYAYVIGEDKSEIDSE